MNKIDQDGSTLKDVRSVAFDTSFLLKEKPGVDKAINELIRDNIKCYITSTVLSVLEQLKHWDRIEGQMFSMAMKR